MQNPIFKPKEANQKNMKTASPQIGSGKGPKEISKTLIFRTFFITFCSWRHL